MSRPKSKPADFETAARQLLAESGCTVRHWRKANSGTAYVYSADWGIETPRPRGPASFSVFAHEIGHQMLHRHGSKPRWLEEIEAHEYSREQFNRFGLDGIDKVTRRQANSTFYAAAKAARRCKAETAARILDRIPQWAWEVDPEPGWRSVALRRLMEALDR